MSMESVLSSSDSSSSTLVSPTPKLSLFSLPHYTPPDTVTPPFQTPASVPFKWEDAPGKPRQNLSGDDSSAKPKAARCLDLPPGKITNTPSPGSEIITNRSSPSCEISTNGPSPGSEIVTNTPSPSSVLDVSRATSFSFRKLLKGEGKITNTPSPSSILDGPILGPGICKTSSFSFRKLLKGEGKITNTPSPGLNILDGPNLGLGPNLGSGFAGLGVSKTSSFSFRKFLKGDDGTANGSSVGLGLGVGPEEVHFKSWRWGSERGFEGDFDFSSPLGGVEEESGTRLRKRSGFWANIYKNVKQAVPWKRRQDKRRKMNNM